MQVTLIDSDELNLKTSNSLNVPDTNNEGPEGLSKMYTVINKYTNDSSQISIPVLY